MVARDGKGNAVVAHRGNVTWRDVARRGGVEEDLMTGHVLGGTTVTQKATTSSCHSFGENLASFSRERVFLHAYDRFVITRCDYFFQCNLNVRKLDKRSIWVPFHKIWLTQEADAKPRAKRWPSLKPEACAT